MSQLFSLKWNDYINNLMGTFQNFLWNEELVDVTLACEGRSLKAHKMVLSASSSFFQSLLSENPCKHPIVILAHVKYTELKSILEFIYHGEVDVPEDRLSIFMETAETLRIKGLTKFKNDYNPTNTHKETLHDRTEKTDSSPNEKTFPKGNGQVTRQNNGENSEPNKITDVTNENNAANRIFQVTPEEMASNANLRKDSHPRPSLARNGKLSVIDQNNRENSDPENKFLDLPKIEFPQKLNHRRTQDSNAPPLAHTTTIHSTASNSSHISNPQDQEQQIDQTVDNIYPPEKNISASQLVISEKKSTEDDLQMPSERVKSNLSITEEHFKSVNSENLVSTSSPKDTLASVDQLLEISLDIGSESLEFHPPTSDNMEHSNGQDLNSMETFSDESVISDLHDASLLTFIHSQQNNVLLKDETPLTEETNVSVTTPKVKKSYKKCRESKRAKCPYCSYSTSKPNYLTIHVRTHTRKMPYKCWFCNKQFADKEDQLKHVKTHTGKKPYDCKFCTYECTRKKDLEKHISSIHKQKPYACSVCDKGFSRKSGLNSHARVHSRKSNIDIKSVTKEFAKKIHLETF